MASTIRHTATRIVKRGPYTSLTVRQMSGNSDANILKSVYKDVPKLNSSITDFVWQNLDRWPDKTATVCAVTGHGYTYAQTHKMSVTFAASLRNKLKLKDDDIVAISLPNLPEYPCVLYGILQAGCIATTLNPAYTSFEFKRQAEVLGLDKLKAIVTSKLSYPQIKEGLDQMQAKIPIIVIDHENIPEGAIKFAEFAEDLSVDTNCLKSVQRTPKDIGVIPFSSGTTGLPKGVVLNHGSVVAVNQMISDPEIVAIRETTATYQAVMPAVLPFFHIFGLNAVMINQMHLGCKLVTMPYFKPDLFLNTIVKHKASTLFIVPPMAIFLGKHPVVTPAHIETVESVICGAAPLSEMDAEAVIAKNKNLIFRQGFGMTETNGTVSIGKNKDTNLATVGYVIGGTEVKIADINTHEALGPGQEGEIWYRGRNNMQCYYNNPEATKEMMTEDGWLRTGDIGRYDDDKYLYVTDRMKELIKVKGFQVPPAELEALIRTNPKVLDCAVIGVPDSILGETPKAYVVVQPNQTLKEEEIKEFINTKVTDYKQVKLVEFIDAIPKSAAGKILRKDLVAKSK